MWVLKTDEGAPDRVTFRIRPGSIKTIGRSSGAEFMVDAALVSRLHCRLTAGATELQVDDLESTNGTFVNGQRVKRSSLKEGDRLGVGRVELIVTRGTDEHGRRTTQKNTDKNEAGHRPAIRNGLVRFSMPIVVRSPWPE
jgi:pSer/pThr/pTyr-binding forkhead associated (FHA) protein